MSPGGKWILEGGKWVFKKLKSKFKKPVEVVKGKGSGSTVSERSIKNMGGPTLKQVKETSAKAQPSETKAETRRYVREAFSDASNFGRRKPIKRDSDYNRTGGKISKYYKAGGNVITGR